ncbi:MAG: hypothetical protein AAF844_11030 [Pseudomonadota bacterium]
MARGLSDLGVDHAFAPGRDPSIAQGDGFFAQVVWWVGTLDQTELYSLLAILAILIVFCAFTLFRPPASARRPAPSALDDRPDMKDRAEIAAAVRKMRESL